MKNNMILEFNLDAHVNIDSWHMISYTNNISMYMYVWKINFSAYLLGIICKTAVVSSVINYKKYNDAVTMSSWRAYPSVSRNMNLYCNKSGSNMIYRFLRTFTCSGVWILSDSMQEKKWIKIQGNRTTYMNVQEI